MNYEKIYNQIVERSKKEGRKKYRKDNIKYVYYEKHHIIPRCMGGSDEKDNLVLLTAREHFICHWLLVRIYTDNKKLIYSFHAMCKQNKSGNRYNPSSRVYEEARKLFLKTYVPWNKGKKGLKNPNAGKSMVEIFGQVRAAEINFRKSMSLKETHKLPEVKERMSNRYRRKGYIISDNTKLKISDTLKKKYSENSIINGMQNKTHSEETKNKIRLSRIKSIEHA